MPGGDGYAANRKAGKQAAVLPVVPPGALAAIAARSYGRGGPGLAAAQRARLHSQAEVLRELALAGAPSHAPLDSPPTSTCTSRTSVQLGSCLPVDDWVRLSAFACAGRVFDDVPSEFMWAQAARAAVSVLRRRWSCCWQAAGAAQQGDEEVLEEAAREIIYCLAADPAGARAGWEAAHARQLRGSRRVLQHLAGSFPGQAGAASGQHCRSLGVCVAAAGVAHHMHVCWHLMGHDAQCCLPITKGV